MEQGYIMRAGTINYGLSEEDIYDSVRSFLSMFYCGPIINGNQNAPLPSDCIVITMLLRKSLSLPSTTYSKDNETETSRRTQLVIFQVDIYGKHAMSVYDSIVVLSMNPTSYFCQSEDVESISLARINERGRLPFVNEQRNYENRYTLDMEFTIYNEISRETEFIDTINVQTIEVK
ncbi:hypothetical protein RCS94_06450 [Orbaceae bacterium ac157xtp]